MKLRRRRRRPPASVAVRAAAQTLKEIPKDPRPAKVLAHYHKHTRRRRVPAWALLVYPLIALVCALVTRIRVSGREHLPSGGPYLLMANHPSVVDHPFVALPTGRRPHFIGKSELFSGRRGWLLNRLGAFPVRRRTWDTEAFQTAETVIERGKVLIWYPEGGCSPVGGYRPAKSGAGWIALRTGAKIVPCNVQGTHRWRTPWKRPKVTVAYGPALSFEREDDPSRERQQQVADEILAAIKALEPSR